MASHRPNAKAILHLFELPEYLAQLEHWETRPKLSYLGVTSISFKSHLSILGNAMLFDKLT